MSLLDFFGNLALQGTHIFAGYGRGKMAADQQAYERSQAEAEKRRQVQRDALQEQLAASLMQDRVSDNQRQQTQATATDAYRDRQLDLGEQRLGLAERTAGRSGEAASRAAVAATRAAQTFEMGNARRAAEGRAATIAQQWMEYPERRRSHSALGSIRQNLRSEFGAQLSEGEIQGIAMDAYRAASGPRRLK